MKLEVRPVRDAELDAAWRVLVELRTHLSRANFEADLARQRGAHGYELMGAFEEGDLVGVLGLREIHTFARGAHLHVDDLVVSANARGQGIGRQLIEHAEQLARERGMQQIFLDSRSGATGFYERRGYRRHESVLMKKHLEENGD